MKREKKKPSILTISLSLIFISVLSITLYNCVGSKVYKKVDEVSTVQNMPSLTRIDSETLPDSIRISIEASDKLDDMIQYTAFKMEAPLRLVLDIPGIDGSRFQEPIDVAKGAVNVIKPLYFVDSNITRIEIGLNQIVPYKILRPEGNILFIDIKNPPSLTEEAIVEGSARPSPPPSSITKVEEKEVVEEEIERRVRVEEEEEGEPPVEAVSEEIEEQGVEEGLEEKEEGIPTVVKVTDVKSKEKEEKKIYIGKPISLDFQNANITNILRLITEVSGYNIITNESVKGKMTLRLNNVPWDQALDIILKNNKLGMEMEGNIIRILPISELLKEQQEKAEAKQAEIDAKKAKERAEPLITEVVRISYADISEMQTNLTSLKSERGSITIDARTNTLILKDIKLNLEEMKNLIKTLDKRTPQVTIEARVVEINKNYTRELGVQWGGKYDTKSNYHQDYTNMRGALIPPAGTAGGIQPIPAGAGNYVVDLPSAIARGAGGGLGLTLGNLGNTNVLDIQ
ncbi:MAG: secretin and TonB N-terminal domain-containing protein, partial [Nitrospinae bacterium]|nr:secretin and TonB N-terminal domain-containing protein [Nitrospinota bacterium]